MKTSSSLVLPLIDLALVVAFALTGRSSHAEGFSFAGLLRTAGPFLLACLIASAGAHLLGITRPGWKNWAFCALATLALGMILRVVLGAGGAPLSFVLVSAIFFLTTMGLGRLLVAALSRRRTTAS